MRRTKDVKFSRAIFKVSLAGPPLNVWEKWKFSELALLHKWEHSKFLKTLQQRTFCVLLRLLLGIMIFEVR
jgi:hypothetical protein